MPASNSPLFNFLTKISKIEASEAKAVLCSFLFVVVLMSAYYILRPVRDAMASDWSDTEVSFLWNINFFVSVVVVGLYGIAVSRIQFKYLVPGVYAFFAASFIADPPILYPLHLNHSQVVHISTIYAYCFTLGPIFE